MRLAHRTLGSIYAAKAVSAYNGSVKKYRFSDQEYQLRLGRQRQVWFISLADERGVCR